MKSFLGVIALGLLLLAAPSGCGARTGLPGGTAGASNGEPPDEVGGTGGTERSGAGQGGTEQGGAGRSGAEQGGGGGGGGAAGRSGGAGQGGNTLTCVEGATQSCGSDVGACEPGTQICRGGELGACTGAKGPTLEVCNGVDDDCNGTIDDGFHIGEPCQGTGSNQCFDGVTTCNGCKKSGPDKVEICNGVDDNCNGIIDADCDVGSCQPTLLVTGSTPSSPGCVDFPVQAGSKGVLDYPCGGGTVTATLGTVKFKGSVSNNFVSIDGEVTIPPAQSPDGCTWLTSHHIEGIIPSGEITYSYSEAHVSGFNCWSPCTEVGTVKILWSAAP